MYVYFIVMATVNDLKNALKNLLAKNGALDRIEAHAKSEVFSALDETVPSNKLAGATHDDEATFLINELILEYMKFYEWVHQCLITFIYDEFFEILNSMLSG